MLKHFKLFTLFMVIGLGCGRKITLPGKKPYHLTKEDRQILRELKKEDKTADKIMRRKLKDKGYHEYIRKTIAENDTLKN
jgi:hypothetical protein